MSCDEICFAILPHGITAYLYRHDGRAVQAVQLRAVVPYDEAGELLPVLGEVRNFNREVVVAREAHDVLESDVERDAIHILEFLQLLAGAQIEYGQDAGFADHCHSLLQGTDVQAPHGVLDFRNVRGKRIVEVYLHYLPTLQA